MAALNATGRGRSVEPVTVRRRRSTMPALNLALDATLHRNDDQPAIFCQTFEFARHISAGHHVQDDVDAGTAGQTLRLFGEVLRAVIDGMVGTQGQAGGAFVVTAGGDDHQNFAHPGPWPSGWRSRQCRWSPPGPAGSPRLQARAVKHIAPDGEKRLGQRGGLDIREVGRHRQALAHRRHAQLRVPAAGHQGAHAVAHASGRPPPWHAASPDSMTPATSRPGMSDAPWRHRIVARALQHVRTVHRTGRHADQHLAPAQPPARALARAQHDGAPYELISMAFMVRMVAPPMLREAATYFNSKLAALAGYQPWDHRARQVLLLRGPERGAMAGRSSRAFMDSLTRPFSSVSSTLTLTIWPSDR
jgi:hypothetical protein